jgi:hypothetical protein
VSLWEHRVSRVLPQALSGHSRVLCKGPPTGVQYGRRFDLDVSLMTERRYCALVHTHTRM